MKSLDFLDCTEEINESDKLESTTLIGWSATCLDQTISYYIDCNSKKVAMEKDIEERDI
jgi:hypothetical protein